MTARFVDTNILLRYFARDDEEKAEAAFALLRRVESDLERVETSPLVIFETVFALQRGYRMPERQIRDVVLPVITMPGFTLPWRRQFVAAFDLYVSTPLSFADAFNVVYMSERGLSEIYSWDTDFDRIQGLTRIEP